ncbi:hypothetical protein [Mucilaginibacter sp. SJ]|uniref:hypothetical protein n=1 Tax=Mucilaginibacter sp. SJ TaxID=3029053 RepID=UPI0023A94E39|nr:hypothetical protein [Mucilaginibacter sp. SJ]WEA03091.1 hypothetical protein MusilaSJ_09115 [Mucilaginibacter sp. SJ]
MNFLSHFYFDRDTNNCYHVLGTVLPDLLKNADKNIILHPEKLHHIDNEVNSIIAGWNKHLDVDRYFHSSAFFTTRSNELKKLLAPALINSPVKPFFLGHIALELIIDNLLLTTGKISVSEFYNHLAGCREDKIRSFLIFAGLEDTAVFFKFYESFKKSQYLHTYAETHQIAYALKRICMRVWKNPFTPEQEVIMDDILSIYREEMLDDFMLIFEEIDAKLVGGE